MFAYLPNVFWTCMDTNSLHAGHVFPLTFTPQFVWGGLFGLSEHRRQGFMQMPWLANVLSQKSYEFKLLIRTNIWLISTILMYMVIHGCCFLFFMGGWRTPPICPLVAQCTNPREAIMGGNARWAVPMSMINIHDNFTCYVIPQRHTDVGRCLASMNTDARDFANQIYLQMFAYFPNCVPSFSQFVYKFLWGQSYKVPHGKPLLTKR